MRFSAPDPGNVSGSITSGSIACRLLVSYISGSSVRALYTGIPASSAAPPIPARVSPVLNTSSAAFRLAVPSVY